MRPNAFEPPSWRRRRPRPCRGRSPAGLVLARARRRADASWVRRRGGRRRTSWAATAGRGQRQRRSLGRGDARRRADPVSARRRAGWRRCPARWGGEAALAPWPGGCLGQGGEGRRGGGGRRRRHLGGRFRSRFRQRRRLRRRPISPLPAARSPSRRRAVVATAPRSARCCDRSSPPRTRNPARLPSHGAGRRGCAEPPLDGDRAGNGHPARPGFRLRLALNTDNLAAARGGSSARRPPPRPPTARPSRRGP